MRLSSLAAVALVLAHVIAHVIAPVAVAVADDGGGGAAPAGGAPPANPEAEAKIRRADLDAEREKLPESARRAMSLLDQFRDKEFRVWSSQRGAVVAEGANALPALDIALRELDWETRALAAACLGEIGHPSAAAALVTAYEREPYAEGKRQYVLALATLRSPAARDLLAQAAKHPDPGVRIAAVRGLGAYEDPALAPELRQYAQDDDLDVRYEARGALAAVGDADTVKSLVAEAEELVKDREAQRSPSKVIEDNGDRYSHYLLGLALARSTDARVGDLLVEVVTAEKPWDHKPFLRMGAAEGLGRRAAATGKIHPKLAAGISHKHDEVRVACTYAAGWARSPELVPKLVAALSDSQLDVRYNAVTALGRTGTPEAAEGLRKALRDKADEVRLGAVRALALVRTPDSTKALLGAVRDEKYMLRVLAARALADRTDEEDVLSTLQRAAKDQDFGVREQALASIAHHGDGAVVMPLLAAGLDDPDYGVRTNACLGLAAISGSAPVAGDVELARKIVSTYLGAREPKLVRAGLEALDAARPPGAVPPLLEALTNDVEETRRRANLALQKMGEASKGFVPDGSKDDRDAAARRWRAWWEEKGGNLPPRGARARVAITGALAEQARDLKWKGLDIALLLDATGSMAGLINAAKERIDEVVEELHDLLPSLRVSVYIYRDYGDDFVFYGTPLTYDTWKLQGFLQDARAAQGGDLPEAVFESVRNATQALKWRPDAHKVVVYAGDAPHHPEYHGAFLETIRAFFTKERQAVLHALFTDTNRRSLDIKSRKKRPDLSKWTSPFFQRYRETAEAGRGRAVLLDDESALIKELLVLTFGEAWRADVENLLDFER